MLSMASSTCSTSVGEVKGSRSVRTAVYQVRCPGHPIVCEHDLAVQLVLVFHFPVRRA